MRREEGHTYRERLFRASPLLALMMLMALALAGGAASSHAPVVAIDSGAVQGVPIASLPQGGAFLGIPYAASPIGNLRWRPPQPPEKWNGVRSAKAYGPACPQRPSPWLPEMLGRTAMVTDEACLLLNVWTPDGRPARRLPVMVWIHGGGNVEGSAEWPPLGETLARQGVVVVSINYRLGIFGFFAHPALSAESPQHVSGNYGQLDQVAALEWVKRNIAHFGGDPHRVTVAGASSGSLDVCNLLASPLAAGLFEGAILQSGVCVDSVFPAAKDAEKNGADFARRLEAGATGDGQSDQQSLAALRAMPAGALLEAAAKDQEVDLEPSVDGWFLREQPAAAFAHGRQMRIPVLVGSNENEVSIFASPLVSGQSYRPRTVAEYRQWLERRLKENAEGVFAAYPAQSDGEATAVFNTMDTDFDFGFGARLLASEMAGVQQRAYLYHFTYVGQGAFAPLGAFHSEESMFVSQRFWTSWIHAPEDARLSAAILGYWVSFVKTGNPNTRGLPVWPAYGPEKDVCQSLGQTIETTPVPRSSRFAVFQERLDERLKGS
jgi:para-nitrobenzyl esterase